MKRLDLHPPILEQRWRQRRPRWVRPDRSLFDPARYDLGRCHDTVAKAFAAEHHYSGTYPASRFAYQLTDRDSGDVAGIAVYGIPASAGVLTGPFPDLEPYVESLELSRLVLLDEVGYNAETRSPGSWPGAITTSLRRGVRGVVAFADPVERRTADGHLVKPGHIGCVYQGVGMAYAGRSTRRRLTVLPDGTVLSDRAASKIRRGERGHDYAERLLVDLGAAPRTAGADATRWLAEALDSIGAHRISHPGCHRYLARLDQRRRRPAAAARRPPVALTLW